MKYFYIQGEDIPYNLNFVINCSFDYFVKYLRIKLKDKTIELKDDFLDGLYIALENNEMKQYSRWIWIKYFDWKIQDQTIIVHEMIHATMAILDFKQIPISKENEETFAYFYQSMMTKVWWKLKKLYPKKYVLRRVLTAKSHSKVRRRDKKRKTKSA